MVKNDMNMEKTKSMLLRSITHRSGGRAAWRSAALLGVALVADLLLSGCKPAAPAEDAPTVTVQVGAAENEPIQLKVIADATRKSGFGRRPTEEPGWISAGPGNL